MAPRHLQSWPGIVHGGGLVAALDAAAARLGGPGGARRLEGRLTASVPVDTALALEGHDDRGVVTLTILENGQPLTATAVTPLAGLDAAPVAAWWGSAAGIALPMSDECLACGARNPVGLRVALSFDAAGVWARLTPPAPWRGANAGLHPALAPVLLDEVAWWLGALVMKEGGLTNRIAVTLLRPDLAWGGPVVAAGRFEDVTPVDRRRTFWRTVSALGTEAGEVLATATIVFRGGAEYSARQLGYFRARTPPDVFRRMFPGYAG